VKLDVYAEREGAQVRVGTVDAANASNEQFEYSRSWLERSDARPLSLSLPLREGPFSAQASSAYFDGLLPEGTARDDAASATRMSARWSAKLLEALGSECIGAVSLRNHEDDADEAYVALSESDLNALSRHASKTAATINARNRVSLPGPRPKVALYRADDGGWFEPRGGAPSTHIVKPLIPEFKNIQLNEAICQMTATVCGLPVPDADILPADVPMFSIRRFDRVDAADSREIDGHSVPARLHQESFSQALGISADSASENDGSRSLQRAVAAIRGYSTRPVDDLRNLWSAVTFNYLIGNCAASLNSLSFIRDESWQELRLAPFYGMSCTEVYDVRPEGLAMPIGGIRAIERIDRAAFEREAVSLHIAPREALRIVDRYAAIVPDAIRDVSRAIADVGFAGAAQIGDAIASGAQIRAAALRQKPSW